MGPVKGAMRAAAVARRFDPRAVLMVGIAGGVPGEAALGDVIVASQVADYTLGKVAPAGRSTRWQVFPADPLLLDAATLLSGDWQSAIRAPRPGPGTPRLRAGV